MKIDERLEKVGSAIQVITAVVTDHSQELKDKAARITNLEAA